MGIIDGESGLLETAAGLQKALTTQASDRHFERLFRYVQLALAAHGESADTGPYAELLATAPHLAGRVHSLMVEHARLVEALEALVAELSTGRGRRFAQDTAELVRLLRRHQMHGSELLHTAYSLDLGGEN